MKTIGTPSAPARPEIVPSLFVLNSRGAIYGGAAYAAPYYARPAYVYHPYPPCY